MEEFESDLATDPEQVERTVCSCVSCKAVCRAKPGELAPGDFRRIAEHVDCEPTESFMLANFMATPGRTVTLENGDTVVAPTIVPAQKSNGDCVFLAKSGRCLVHPVAPFGCSRFNECSVNEDDPARDAILLSSCFRNAEYLLHWVTLHAHGKSAADDSSRSAVLKSLIEGLDVGNHDEGD